MVLAALVTGGAAFVVALFIYNAQFKQRVAEAARAAGAVTPTHFPLKEPFLGVDFRITTHGDITTYQKFHEKYGKTFMTTPMMCCGMLSSVDKENLQAWYKRNDDWGVEPHRLEPMSHLCGDGFLTRDGEIWKKSRNLIKPSFQVDNLRDMTVFSAEVDKLTNEIPADGTTVDLKPMLSMLFLNSAMHFLLSTETSDDESAGAPCTKKEYLDAFGNALFGTGLKILFGRLWLLLPKAWYERACSTVHAFVDFQVEKSMREESSAKSNGSKSRSMLNSLVKQTDDRAYIRSQVIQALMAAQETTGFLVANTVFLLSRNLSYWERIRAEVVKLGDDALTFNACSSSKLLQNILYESIRIYPIFPYLGRKAYRDTVLPRGGGPDGTLPILVPKGTDCITSFYTLHRDPNVFGEDVEVFRPERWASKEDGGDAINPSQFEFMPFGGGERACLGRHKALAEAAYIVTKLAQQFEVLESRDDKPWKMDQKLTCSNLHGCKVAFRKSAT